MDPLINPPDWAVSNEALSFYYGFALAALVRLSRAGLRWLKRTGQAERGD